jgi:phage terminase large subunit-like protein
MEYWKALERAKESEFQEMLQGLGREDRSTIEQKLAIWSALPQPQEIQKRTLDCEAKITLIGGSKGSAKTYTSLMWILGGLHLPGYEGLVLRRSLGEIEQVGGLLSVAEPWYKGLDGKKVGRSIRFPNGSKIVFTYCETMQDARRYDGAQIPRLVLDEVQFMDEEVVVYLLTRLRTPLPMRARALLSCNPEPASWLHNWLETGGYVDPDTGMPSELCGTVRYLYFEGKRKGEITPCWHDGEKKAEDGNPVGYSFTFLPSVVYDNKILCEKDPEYVASLEGQPLAERMRSLYGCWKGVTGEGILFRRDDIEVREAPRTFLETFWSFDTAATAKERSDYSAGIYWGLDEQLRLWILDWWQKKLEFPDLKEKVWRCLRTTNTYGVVEFASSGIQLAQEAELEHGLTLIGQPAGKGDLYHRSLPLQLAFENQYVALAHSCPNYEGLQQWLMKFDGDLKKKDDAVSAAVVGYTHAKTRLIGGACPDPDSLPPQVGWGGIPAGDLVIPEFSDSLFEDEIF